MPSRGVIARKGKFGENKEHPSSKVRAKQINELRAIAGCCWWSVQDQFEDADFATKIKSCDADSVERKKTKKIKFRHRMALGRISNLQCISIAKCICCYYFVVLHKLEFH